MYSDQTIWPASKNRDSDKLRQRAKKPNLDQVLSMQEELLCIVENWGLWFLENLHGI